MKENIIPTNNLFLELDDIDNFKDLSKLSSKDIIIISTKYHQEINDSLIADYITTIKSENINYSLGIIEVPGAFELIYTMKKVIDKFSPKLILAVGCIIKGDTRHDEYLSNSIINSMHSISIEYITPIINGVITTNNLEQAIERAGKKYRKGKEFALTSIAMLSLAKSLDQK
jgi:6,7-dimethyl-8-ribityllumazine synthase